MENIFVVIILFIAGYAAASKWLAFKKSSGSNRADNNEKNAYHDNHSDSLSRTWYKVLEVPENASYSQIIDAYRKQMRLYHPDKVSNLGEELRILAEEKSKQINAAYKYASELQKNGGR